MDAKLLIDDLVRQTTVLIARLSTSAGIRAPLAHLADQVFVDLSRELENAGVRRKVVADMFGLALRSYQLKVQRLTEGGAPQVSLWQSVHALLEQGSRSKQELVLSLKTAEPKDLSTVLNDLVGSGLAYKSGRGALAVFGLTTDAERERFSRAARHQSRVNLIWLLVATGQAKTEAQLASLLDLPELELQAPLAELLGDGRLVRRDAQLDATSFHIPVGSEQGWEAAVADHFRAVTGAIAAKLSRPRSKQDDTIGGATLSFTVHPGHPHQAAVLQLLSKLRQEVGSLWTLVEAHNKSHPLPQHTQRVTFYFGQNVTPQDSSDAEPVSADPGTGSTSADSD